MSAAPRRFAAGAAVRLRRAAVAALAAVVPGRQAWAGVVAGRVLGLVLAVPVGPVGRRVMAARRGAQFLAASGHDRFVGGFVRGIARSPAHELGALAHELLVERGDLDIAEDVAARLGRRGVLTRDEELELRIDRLVAAGAVADALGTLAEADGTCTPGLTHRELDLLLRTGRPAEVLDRLDGAEAIAAADRAALRFDALWLLGDRSQAVETLRVLGRRELVGRIGHLRRWRDAMQSLGASPDEILEELLIDGPSLPPDWVAVARFEIGDLDGLLDDVAGPSFAAALGPTGWYHVARAHYVQRRFAEARSLLPRLAATHRHWDADKLDARMLLEEGDAHGAYEQRRRLSRLRPAFDEVEYFAGLHLGRFAESFAQYLHAPDRARLRAQFGARAEEHPEPDAGSRLVIQQNGPGDEILVASTFADLLAGSGSLTVTCDPRLESLLARSFPAVRFVPVERLSSRPQLGFLDPATAPRRADGVFFDLLDERAHDEALGSDRVLLGRSLPRTTPGRAPYAPYLAAEPRRVAALEATLGAGAIGVVWRSEYVDPLRAIHYLEAAELGALATHPGRFVCLQHDAGPAERDELRRALDGRVTFLDDLDLRDDFETMAAAVRACRAVVGVGTTIVELAAAVGTPTITLYPSLIGAWRRTGPDGADYWHQRMAVAAVRDYRDRQSCVEEAAMLLGQLEST